MYSYLIKVYSTTFSLCNLHSYMFRHFLPTINNKQSTQDNHLRYKRFICQFTHTNITKFWLNKTIIRI